VFVIDDARDDIQKFESDGTFLLKFGSHGTGDGELNYTGNLAIDRQGNIYVADFSNHRVQKFDRQGKFLTKWGSQGEEPGQFNEPSAVAVDQQGNVFVVEYTGTHRVQIFDEAGNFLGTWGGPGLEDGQFLNPVAIAIDSQGYIYVSDEANRIQKFRPTNYASAGVNEFPVAGSAADVIVPPGHYRAPDALEIPFEFEVGEGFTWFREYLEEDKTLVLVRGSNAAGKPSQWLAFMPLKPGETVDSAMEALRATPKIDLLEEADTSIGGASGRQLDAAAQPNPAAGFDGLITIPAIAGLTGHSDPDWWTETPTARLRFYAIDFNSRTLLVYLEAPPGEFDAFAQDIEEMLDSLAFIDPDTAAPAPNESSPTTPGIPEFPKYAHPDLLPPEVAAGIYRTPSWFSIPFTFETAQDTLGIGDDEPTGELFGLGVKNEIDFNLLMFLAVDPEISVDETITLFRDTPDFEIGPNQPVQVAGFSGTQFDLVFTGNGESKMPAVTTLIGHPVFGPENYWTVPADTRQRILVLDVRERAFVIYIDAYRHQFEAFAHEVEQVLETLEFEAQ
jgi:hypothetical protein